MMMGYYDQYAYPDNMYAGPANGGVCPMNNETAWPDPLGGSSGYCPLSATKDGLDGRLIKGHVDDYWVAYGQFGNDPYAGNWTEHTYGDCTGDYMGTNQDKWNNPDGSTAFAFMPKDNPDYAGYPLYDYTGGEASGWRDGGHGMRLFAESRGYTFPLVSPPKPVEPGLKADVFNQHILGYAHATRGFTFADYKAEIDNLRPVLIHVVGHTMLGFGYDDTGNTVYLCDTWDNNYHTMTWGGSYSGHVHTGVTCFNITDPTPVILSGLRAETGHGRIRVIWETATEFGAAGYVVLRSERLRGPFERINHGIIAATGQPGEIAKYEFVDESVQPGRTYFYRIAEVAPDGAIEELPDLTKAVAGGAMLYNLLPPQLRALLPL